MKTSKNSKNKFLIILTNDYEVFGDGSGDPYDVLIRPTDQLLEICNEYNVPMTLFVDVLELYAFQRAEKSKVFGTEYKVATDIENQITQAIVDGHDVQLHFHPQWIGAKPEKKDKWIINRQYWRLPYVPGGLGHCDDPVSLRGLFLNGKFFLESLICPLNPGYKCIAFRAGGYCIQPEKDVLEAMGESGFLIDSSVCPGKKTDKGYAMSDFRKTPSDRPYWKVTESVTTPNNSGRFLEIPISTCRQPRLSQFENVSKKKGKDVLRACKALMWPQISNFDFCKLSFKEMKFFLLSAIKKFEKHTGPIPIVITGHSKEYRNNFHFKNFLQWALCNNQVRFSTFDDFLEQLKYDT